MTDKTANDNNEPSRITSLNDKYKKWFVDYASYVILERAVPNLYDGLKPVQRRIMHSMYLIDDGRYTKVANIIGNTMLFHPHGDASIGDALVQLGQKDLLVDTQGNWGNIYTGDNAAAPRYIEARLSEFAKEVMFNPKITEWKQSYDGRNKEPIMLPVKFPLLLAQGVEGIAVGLASKILPHNFCELMDASVDILNNKETNILPDFITGGIADFTDYNRGLRGAKVKVRAKISQINDRILVIDEIPFGTSTSSLLDSIVAANDKGKIKIKKIEDNTADKVELRIHLQPNTDINLTINSLYAFTDCEVTLFPNSCVIQNDKPVFLDVNEILRISTEKTVEVIRKEFEVKRHELMEHLMFLSLEKIFIENKIYNSIETCNTWELVLKTIELGLEPFKDTFYREIKREDVVALTEIKIKRISKFDADKADKNIKNIEVEIKKIDHNIKNIIKYTIDYFLHLKEKYGKNKQRRTEIAGFKEIKIEIPSIADQKLYVNREEGFAGYGAAMRAEEFLAECSENDELIVFRENGTFVVSKVAEKMFIGKDIIHVALFKKNDEKTIYNVIYRDGLFGNSLAKRFSVSGIIRDKEYNITKGTEGTKVIYFGVGNDEEPCEKIIIFLRPKPKLKRLSFEFDFNEVLIKNRSAMGIIVNRNQIRKIVNPNKTQADSEYQKLWFDIENNKLSLENKGEFIDKFQKTDKLLIIHSSGYYRLADVDLSINLEKDIYKILKFDAESIITAIYREEDKPEIFFIKRFNTEKTVNRNQFLSKKPKCRLVHIFTDKTPIIEITFEDFENNQKKQIVKISEFATVSNFKSQGLQLSDYPIKSMSVITHKFAKPKEEEIDNALKSSPENLNFTQLGLDF